ncbi:hypothetical protein [Desulforhopalus vacuolatus]|nr:hypothetical protein [Desulforhopalus vacuolatus]
MKQPDFDKTGAPPVKLECRDTEPVLLKKTDYSRYPTVRREQ